MHIKTPNESACYLSCHLVVPSSSHTYARYLSCHLVVPSSFHTLYMYCPSCYSSVGVTVPKLRELEGHCIMPQRKVWCFRKQFSKIKEDILPACPPGKVGKIGSLLYKALQKQRFYFCFPFWSKSSYQHALRGRLVKLVPYFTKHFGNSDFIFVLQVVRERRRMNVRLHVVAHGLSR